MKDLLIKDLKNCINEKKPIDFFTKLVDVLSYMCEEISSLKDELATTRTAAALAIKWDSRVALQIIEGEIKWLRNTNPDFYKPQIDELKKAYREDVVTQEYETFCNFWLDVIGVHPFIDYRDRK